jgi:hypothetical protein
LKQALVEVSPKVHTLVIVHMLVIRDSILNDLTRLAFYDEASLPSPCSIWIVRGSCLTSDAKAIDAVHSPWNESDPKERRSRRKEVQVVGSYKQRGVTERVYQAHLMTEN